MRTIIEPFRIKIGRADPHDHPRGARARSCAEAGYNLFRIRADDVILIDLLTDSGTGAMSAEQWAGDHARRRVLRRQRAASFRFESAVQDIFGFEHVIPTHQGRAAERILFAMLVQAGQRGPEQHPLRHHAGQRRVPRRAGRRSARAPRRRHRERRTRSRATWTSRRWSGLLERATGERSRCVMITVTNNSGGGQPVSMANIRAAREIVPPARRCRSTSTPAASPRTPTSSSCARTGYADTPRDGDRARDVLATPTAAR